jgi:hypothetical protein
VHVRLFAPTSPHQIVPQQFDRHLYLLFVRAWYCRWNSVELRFHELYRLRLPVPVLILEDHAIGNHGQPERIAQREGLRANLERLFVVQGGVPQQFLDLRLLCALRVLAGILE